jgi:hypothetical protein
MGSGNLLVQLSTACLGFAHAHLRKGQSKVFEELLVPVVCLPHFVSNKQDILTFAGVCDNWMACGEQTTG